MQEINWIEINEYFLRFKDIIDEILFLEELLNNDSLQ